ncbi:SYMPK [Linum perenne]
MVGMLSSASRERLARLVDSAKSSAADIPAKLDSLRQLREILLEVVDAGSLSEFVPSLLDLQCDHHSPVRKSAAEIIGELGLKHLEFIPEIGPVLMTLLEDSVPAVARQAITCGIQLFRSTLAKIAFQGLHKSVPDDLLKSAWSSMLEFKEKVYSIAFQVGSGGVKLLSLKFVEAVIILYTPDPKLPLVPPKDEGELLVFNIAWFRARHPVLNVGDLAIEASRRLASLLDQLRPPTVKSLSNLVIIVIIKSLATIAKQRPLYFGRIIPVLLGLDPSSSVVKGMTAPGSQLALKNAFLTCLKCTHPVSAPWRDRLVGALGEMKGDGLAEEALHRNSKSNGTLLEGEKDLFEDDQPVQAFDANIRDKLERKRSGDNGSTDSAESDGVSRKRAKSMRSKVADPKTESTSDQASPQQKIPSHVAPNDEGHDDSGPVKQLVAMFGALVAQGEKAVGSLEILISSISADLLAEVVMANMRLLPHVRTQIEGDNETVASITILGSSTQAKYPASFVADVVSLSTTFPSILPQLGPHEAVSNELVVIKLNTPFHTCSLKLQGEKEVHISGGSDDQTDDEMLPTVLPDSSAAIPSLETDDLSVSSDLPDVDNLKSEIPGLDSSARDDVFSEDIGASSLVSNDIEAASQEQVASVGATSMLDSLPSIFTEKSEELSSKAAAITDSNSVMSSMSTSVALPSTLILPKMAAPVVDLADDEKDQLQTLAFTRIVEAYKQIELAGLSQVRFSLLACLGVELPSELEPWKVLEKHILSDYVNLEGHELTLRVLYRLYREIEEERDFFSSTTAASVYDIFFRTVAETLRDSFPPSDKSLSRLLVEAPSLPKSVLNLLESLCCPENSENAGKVLQSGDRVIQGLSTVWNLIMSRPPIREASLKIALQSATHHAEEVRMKAIRLVANKLYPLPSVSQQIEDFAKETMLSVVDAEDVMESKDEDGAIVESCRDSSSEKLLSEHMSMNSKVLSCDSQQTSVSESQSSRSTEEAQRCLSLFFALCTKKHSLFRQIFVVYKSAPEAVKQAVHMHIPVLVRTMGSSSELLEIISDPPDGSKKLLTQVLLTLTEGAVPSPALLLTIKRLYNSKLKDVDILIPVLPYLPSDEILATIPQFVNLTPDKFQAVLLSILQPPNSSGPLLTPSEVLIAIHGIDPDRDGIPLKKVTDACNACFEQRQIFTQAVIAKVLNQLVEQIPLPLLFMRTVIQAIGAFPALVEFIMEILSRLVSKQIWKYPKLWVGFLKCALLTKPQSFSVLLQLPPPQLENALNRTGALRAPLVAHASQPHIKSTLPRSILVVLGIATEPQSTAQSQPSQEQTAETSTSEKDVAVEKPSEPSSDAS